MLRINPASAVIEARGKRDAALIAFHAQLAAKGIAPSDYLDGLFDTVQASLTERGNAVKALRESPEFYLISTTVPKRSAKVEREVQTVEINGVLETVNAIVSETGTGATRRIAFDVVADALHATKGNETLRFLLSEVSKSDTALREARLALQSAIVELQRENLLTSRIAQLNGTSRNLAAGVTVLHCNGALELATHSVVSTKATYDVDTLSFVLRSHDAPRLQRLKAKAHEMGILCTDIESVYDVQGEATRGIGSKRNQVTTYSEVISDRNRVTRSYYQMTLVRCGERLTELTNCKPQPWSVFCETLDHAKLTGSSYYAKPLPGKRRQVDKSSISYKSAKGEALTDSDIATIERSETAKDSNRVKRELADAYRAIDTKAALDGLIDEALAILQTEKADTVNAIMERDGIGREAAKSKRFMSKLTDDERSKRLAEQARLHRERRARLKAAKDA